MPRADGSGVSSTVTTGYPQSPQPQRFVRGAGTGGGRGADDYFVSRLYEEHAGFLLVFVQRLTGGDLHWHAVTKELVGTQVGLDARRIGGDFQFLQCRGNMGS